MPLRGQAAMNDRMRQLARRYPDRVGAALRYEAELVATAAKQQTPVDTGALRASIHAEGPKRSFAVVEAKVVAGGPSAPYAVIVHEDLAAFHRVGNAKFIERPLMAALPGLAERVAMNVSLEDMG